MTNDRMIDVTSRSRSCD